jgi:2-polyprenyl-6-methoxyphenol hydroxylase-like FAD-dependent oxidoreductase
MHVPRQRTDPRPRRVGHNHEHAVVLGGSMAGLLAARVLAEHFRKVTIVERDHLATDGLPRRGAPQGRHAHVLLPRGAEIIEELFPGILLELCRGGAPIADSLSQLHFSANGHLLNQKKAHDRHSLYEPSRPLLEGTVFGRVRDLPNVTVLDGFDVEELTVTPSGTAVTGARLFRRGPTPALQLVDAQLVVAATGRGGRAGAWLTQMGYPRPPERSVHVDLKYASTLVRFAPGAMGGLRAVLIWPTPDRPYGAVSFAQEGHHWLVSLAGYAGCHPSSNREAWLAFADRVFPGEIAAALRQAELLDEIRPHHFTANLRRHYEKMSSFPTGFLVVGDAVCSLNPIYGQGMTVAALEALALRRTLQEGSTDLARRFFKAVAKPVGDAWSLAVRCDLAMPESFVPGPRPIQVRAVNAYLDRFQAAAEKDPAMARRFINVTSFDEPALHLFGPGSLRKVAADRLQRRRAPA